MTFYPRIRLLGFSAFLYWKELFGRWLKKKYQTVCGFLTLRLDFQTRGLGFLTMFLKVRVIGRGGGEVVIVFALNSDDPSLNPAEAYSFLCKRMKINKKEAGLAHF